MDWSATFLFSFASADRSPGLGKNGQQIFPFCLVLLTALLGLKGLVSRVSLFRLVLLTVLTGGGRLVSRVSLFVWFC